MVLKSNIALDKEYRTAVHGRAKEVLKKNPKASAKELQEALVVIPVEGIATDHLEAQIALPEENEPLLRAVIDRITEARGNRLFLVALEQWLSDAGL